MATLVMSQKERDSAALLKEVDKGRLSAREAAERLGVSRRHVFRLLKRYRAEGDAGLIHRLRGQSSNHSTPESHNTHEDLETHESQFLVL